VKIDRFLHEIRWKFAKTTRYSTVFHFILQSRIEILDHISAVSDRGEALP
jgi:hypothetical protein